MRSKVNVKLLPLHLSSTKQVCMAWDVPQSLLPISARPLWTLCSHNLTTSINHKTAYLSQDGVRGLENIVA